MKKKVVITLALILYSISTAVSYLFFASSGSTLLKTVNFRTVYKPPTQEKKIVIDENAPKTEECPLSGELLTEGHRKLWESRRPLTVMIENHTDARPQSGLTSADVIYEAVAEGGITRFLTIFYCKDSDGLIGPIRSARIYFINLATAYGNHPLYTHVGGANCNKATGSGCGGGALADALGKIRKLNWQGYNDLDFVPFPVMFRNYERLSSVTEHTVYSSTKKLWDYARDERELSNVDKDDNQWDEDFTPWKFKDDKPADKPVSEIKFDFWQKYKDFSVKWVYEPTANSYKRFNGGTPHTDLNNKKQLTAKNVAVVLMEESVARDGYDKGQHLLYKTTGQGDAVVFQDGRAIEGTWRRKDENELIRFYDKSGSEISLNRGQVFVEIVPEGNEIVY